MFSSHKNEQNTAICSNLNEPTDPHSKWCKSDRKWQISCDIAYMQNLKSWYKWTYLQNQNTVRDVENKPIVTRQESKGWPGGIN